MRRTRLAITLAAAISAVVCMVSPSIGLSTAATHYACSTPNSAKVPCHFSTPSGNIRCLWTPKPNNVACVLLASKRAYARPATRRRSG